MAWWLVLLIACGPGAEPAPPIVAAVPKPSVAVPKAKGPPRARPTPKRCLPPPTGDGLGDEGVASSTGLSYEAIKTTMDGFVHETLSCVPPGTTPNGTVATELTVACSGVVSKVTVTDDGGLPPELVKCVQETLYFAEFPAHALPDGETFGYPVTFRF